jgi:hypothetical protein
VPSAKVNGVRQLQNALGASGRLSAIGYVTAGSTIRAGV